MAETIQLHDFIELDYTGKLTDGMIFDTTLAEVAKKNGFYSEKAKYGSVIICVGEQQILPGLDNKLLSQEVGKELHFELTPEEAFGKRDIKKVKIVPMSTFIEHKMNPQPGLQIEVDGEMGTINRVASGRVIVNFNHPLAGKEVAYEVKVKRRLTDNKEKIVAFLNNVLRIPKDKIQVQVEGENVKIELPWNMPEQLIEVFNKKLEELLKLKVEIKAKLPDNKN